MINFKIPIAFLYVFIICILNINFSVAQTPPPARATLKIYSDYEQVSPGSEFMLVAEFKIEPNWYLYYRNPGTAGLPTKVDFDLPTDLVAKPLIWTTPQKFVTTDEIIGYGYPDKASFLLPVKLSENTKLDKLNIKLNSSWLACSDKRCQPNKAEAEINIPVGENLKSKYAKDIAILLTNQPRSLAETPELGHTDFQIITILPDGNYHAELILKWTSDVEVLYWVPEKYAGIKIRDTSITKQGFEYKINIMLSVQAGHELPNQIDSILVFRESGSNNTRAVNLPIGTPTLVGNVAD